MLDTLKMLPMLARLKDLMPKTVSSGAVPGGREEGRHARRDPDPEVLARGRRALHHAADGVHEGPRDRHAQHRHLPHAGVRRADDRDALAAAQGWRAALPHRRADGEAARGRRRARRRPGAAVRRHGADAGRARRAAARRLPPPRARRAGQVRDGGSRGARERADRPRRLRRAGRAPARGAVRRSHRLLLASRRLPGLPPHLRDAAQEPDLPDDRRRHSADGGLLPRQGERAHLPAADQEDGARDRGHELSRPRASSTTSSSSRSTSAIPGTRARS